MRQNEIGLREGRSRILYDNLKIFLFAYLLVLSTTKPGRRLLRYIVLMPTYLSIYVFIMFT